MSANHLPSTTEALSAHIASTPDTCGGKPRIAGSRIRVQDIVVWHERMSLSADEIVSRFPHLSLADVYAALSYYHDHRTQIDADMLAGRELVEELRAHNPTKMDSKRAANE